ncbi:chemotaxis protein CheB [Portibacter marinus]|uniref:chemotaxis protein CheB n=1 Tax=Portibacter marinus TaxID=2898660 RepID=UPI001F3A10BC|nr:chemotaxis protein CheB [Portibacter marinus]
MSMKVVGIGASAGGVDALKKFLDHLEPDLGAAYVIIQHLSPNYKSVMEDLLRNHTSMPIHQIQEDQFIEPNHVYLMPPNKTLTYQYGLLKLHDRDETEKLNLPIDKFFHSLGRGLKKNAVAIILSGSGTDGSRGARTVKENDGVVMVQSPETSEFDGMPKALLNLGIVDIQMAPGDLAKKLKNVLELSKFDDQNTQDYTSGEKTKDEQYERIVQLASIKSDIPFKSYKRPTLYRRIEKQRVFHEMDNLEAYHEFLLDNDDQLELLAREFLINVTKFFRDSEVFDTIASDVLKKIFDNLQPDEICRVWVVACSTGEEAYSLAILILEFIEANNIKNDFKIFASDVNSKGIDFATVGCYNSSISSDVPAKYLNKYFIEDEGNFYVKPILREKVIFAIHDAIVDPPFINMDLITCRNFLIYLESVTQQKILKTFYFSLKSERFLVLGPSESLGEFDTVFHPEDSDLNIFVKQNVNFKSSSREIIKGKSTWKRVVNRSLHSRQNYSATTDQLVEDVVEPFSKNLIEEYSPRTVFLDEDLTILYLKGSFQDIFSLPRNTSEITLHSMLPPSQALLIRDGVRLAIESGIKQVFKDVIFKRSDQKIRTDITFQKFEFKELKDPVVRMTFKDENFDEIDSGKSIIIEIDEANYISERLIRSEKVIDEKKQELKELKLKLEDLAEKLHSSNQELLASNEELQSSNEELQSLNEELHTVNQELQYKNKELSNSNNDMNNLLTSTQIATIFLDSDCRIRKFTPAITKQFQIEKTDINRPISTFSSKLVGVDIMEVSKQVMRTEKEYEQEILDDSGTSFILKVIPYIKDIDIVDGVVVTLVDVDKIVKAKNEANELGVFFKKYLDMQVLPYLLIKDSGRIIFSNSAFENNLASLESNENIIRIFDEPSIEKIENAIQGIKKSKKSKILKNVEINIQDQHETFNLHLEPLFEDDLNKLKLILLSFHKL